MKNILLVGGGHAHLPALRQASVPARFGARVTLVAPETHHYCSGMGPGILGGIYRPRQTRVAVERLIHSRGGHFVRGAVARIDPAARTVTLSDGRTLPFDLASFNTGSRVPVEQLPGAQDERVIPVKPIERLVQARRLLLENQGNPRRCVLYRNLLSSLKGDPLTPFRPQKRYVLILNLGDGTGLVVWGPWVWRGRLGFRWKNHFDTSFMERFQRCGELQETDTEEPWAS